MTYEARVAAAADIYLSRTPVHARDGAGNQLWTRDQVARAFLAGNAAVIAEDTPAPISQMVATSDPIAWAEVYDGKIVTVQLDKSKWHTTPLYMSAPADLLVGTWLPIERADKTITNIEDFSEVGVIIQTSDRYWVRDDDGRVYEAAWSIGNNGDRDYWWDFEGESPVDPIEFMPHPFDPRFASAEVEG